jgi:iron complex outermembrane receptor protein
MNLKLFLTTLLLLNLLISYGNETTSSIKGKVNTSDGQAAAGVTVLIKGRAKGAVTDEKGNFIFRNLPPGTYELEVSLVGHNTVIEKVNVAGNETANINIQLQLSQQELEAVVIKSGLNTYKSNSLSSSLRLQTPLLEVPQNIQVINHKVLSDQQIISMSDGVVRNVSGAIRMEHWGDMYTNITARGSQVQAFRNGFNVVNSYWGPLTEDMSYVDHIEFVKGPAGFMLANGDPSGLYNVVTKKPTGQTKGEFEFTIGRFDLFRSSLDLDGRLSKDGRLLYRLNLSGQQKNSHRPNEYNNRYAVAPVISYQLDEKTKLTAEYNLQYAKMSDVGSFYVYSPDGYGTLPVDFTTLPAGLPGTKITDQSFFLNLQHELGTGWKLTTQALYSRYRQQGTSMWPSTVNPDGTMIRAVGSWEAKSDMTLAQAFINGNLATGAVNHRMLGGVDLGNKEYFADWGQNFELDSVGGEFNIHAPFLGVPPNGYPQFDFSTPLEERAEKIGGLMSQRYTGVYFQDELGFINNKLRLTLAGRYTYVKQAEWGGSPSSAKHFTPRIGLSLSVNKETSVYALYDQAFIPQQGKLSNGNKVQPITGNNIEAGIKREWAGGKWNSTLSVYRIIKNNELTADPFSNPSDGLSIELGQKQSQGIEFDLKGKITNGLNLIANYAYTNSKITKLAEGVTGQKVGDYVPGFAKHTANSWLNYKIQSGVLKGAGFSAGFTWLIDRQTYWDPSPAGGDMLDNYFKLDAGAFWEKDKVRITANVFNVLDEYLYTGSWYAYLNAYYWQTDAPRNIRLSISYKF